MIETLVMPAEGSKGLGAKKRDVLEVAQDGHVGHEHLLGSVSSCLYLSLSLSGLSLPHPFPKGTYTPHTHHPGLKCLEEVDPCGGATLSQALEFGSQKKWVGEKQEGVLSKAVP